MNVLINRYKKRLIFYLSFFLFCTLVGISCKKSTCPDVDHAEAAKKFEIHLQRHFNNNHVFIRIDGKSIFSGAVTTNYVVGLAATIAPQLPAGDHQIETFIQGREADTTFSVQDTLIIGIIYDASLEEISYNFYEPPHLPIYE